MLSSSPYVTRGSWRTFYNCQLTEEEISKGQISGKYFILSAVMQIHLGSL